MGNMASVPSLGGSGPGHSGAMDIIGKVVPCGRLNSGFLALIALGYIAFFRTPPNRLAGIILQAPLTFLLEGY